MGTITSISIADTMTSAESFTFEFTLSNTPSSSSFLATFAASPDEQKTMTYTCTIIDTFSCTVNQQPSINGIYNLKSVEGTDEVFTFSAISITVKLNNVDKFYQFHSQMEKNVLNLLLRIF